jgi:hypothetical protein
VRDLVKEKEDKDVYKKSNVAFLRPPRTSKEALEVLKEVDVRYDKNKKHLYGDKSQSEENKDEEEEGLA